jgi:hypothetical protein
MTVIGAHGRHGSQLIDSQQLLGSHGHRAPRLSIGDGLGDILLHNELRLAIDGKLHVVAHIHLGTLGPRSALGIGPGELGLTARRAFLHQAALALLALFAALDRFLKLLSGRWMNTGVRASGCIPLTQVLLPLLIEVLEGLLKFCLRKVLVCVVDSLAFPALDGKECCPKAIQLLAKKDKRSEESLQRLCVMFSDISDGLEVGSQCSKQPDELYVARGFPLKPSAGSEPVEVSIDVEREHIPGIVGRSTSACGLSPRESKTRKLETRHIRLKDTERMIFCDIVSEKIRQQTPLGPAVTLKGSHPASLLCIGGRLYCKVRVHKEFSHSLVCG